MAVKKPRSKKMSKDNIDLLLEHGLNLDNRSIWLGRCIDDESEPVINDALMERFVRSLAILNSSAKKDPITVYLNTVGGDELAGMGCYDAIKASKSPVDIIAVSKVMSMGMVIMQSARTRIMMPNAVFMTHVGDRSQSGHKVDVKRWHEFSERYDARMDAICMARIKQSNPKFTRAEYDKLNEFDTILMPEEAIELGFADRLFDPKKDKL